MFPLNDSVVGDEDRLDLNSFQFSWLLLMLIFVLPSNFFVFISIRKRPSCFQPINVFQFNLVFSTLCYSILVLPAVVITSYLSVWPFGNIFCWLSGFLSTIYFGGIMSSLGLTLLQKFFVIRHSNKCAFKPGWKAIAAVAFVWTLQVLLASFPTIIRSDMEEVYVFSATCFSCVPNWRLHKEFSIFWVFLSFLYPLAMIVFCGSYLFIYKLDKFRRVCAETSVRSSHYRLLPINMKSPSDQKTIDGSFPDINYAENYKETDFATPQRLPKAGEDLSNQQVYDQLLPHSPITEESTNPLSNYQVFSFDDKCENESKMEEHRQNNKRMIALNTEKSEIRTIKETKDLKKTAWKIILFMITLLIFTAPFVIVFVMETLADGNDSTNYNLPVYFGTFAALMFYSIPGFVVIFLIISDDNIRGIIHKAMRCGSKKKKSTSNDDIHLISTNMDLFESDSTETLQQQPPPPGIMPSNSNRFHNHGFRKEIKLAWPSFSEEGLSSSTSAESSNNIQYLCDDDDSDDAISTCHISVFNQQRAMSEKLYMINSSDGGEVMLVKGNSLPANLSLMSSASSLFQPVPNENPASFNKLPSAAVNSISRERSASTWSVLSSRLSLLEDQNQQHDDNCMQLYADRLADQVVEGALTVCCFKE